VSRNYGLPPEKFKEFRPRWDEYMHYLYLPVVMPAGEEAPRFVGESYIRLPPNLEWIRPVVEAVCIEEGVDVRPQYVYVTARRGYASPGNPLNRPGWHADGFGTNDVNYIWSDRWPTRFAYGEFIGISDDHVKSAEQFEWQVTHNPERIRIVHGEPFTVYRLDPSVIHATPIIEPPGGDRSFFKISVSPDRYNLLGNSHNHLFDYEWRMWSRSEVRNDPAYAGGDSGPQEGT
jgi:hypothetical protein